MKKYISADLHVINLRANDIVTTSETPVTFTLDGNFSGEQRTGERRGWDEF